MARILAYHGERGFEMFLPEDFETVKSSRASSIFEETLNRLALIGDHKIIPASVRKMASHCGGVPPKQPLLPAFKDTPMVADPSNAVYAKIVRGLMLLEKRNMRKPWQIQRVEHIESFNDEHLGDLIEASLAAADMASAFESNTVRSWATLVGGAHGGGDEVTEWLVHAVHWEVGQRWPA